MLQFYSRYIKENVFYYVEKDKAVQVHSCFDMFRHVNVGLWCVSTELTVSLLA